MNLHPVIGFILACLLVKVMGECDNIQIRRNYVSLTLSERSQYTRVFQIMYRQGVFDELARIHTENFRRIHDYPQFLIWHRYFVWDFEKRMQNINPELVLPYWDGAADYLYPHQSQVFSPSAFGGSGDPINHFCIFDGWMSSININYPERGCLKRDFQGPTGNTIHPWHSPAFITSLIQTSSTFDDFRANIEHTLHNSIHFGIGGYNGDFSKHYSPVDALFFLHHANIDRIYAKWQMAHPQHLDAIDGNQLNRQGFVESITPSFRLDYYDIPVGDLLQTINEPLCYSYDDIAEDKPELTNKVENRLRQLPRRLLQKYFPKFMKNKEDDDDEDTSADHDFPNARSLKINFNRPIPNPLTLPQELFARFGFNVTRGLEVQQRVQKFVQDMNQWQVKRRNLRSKLKHPSNSTRH